MGAGMHDAQSAEAAPPDYRLKASISGKANQAAQLE
jgi:hypothetical protein